MLELANINKRYNERQILKNVSEKFNRCGLVFLLGDSGAGKTSLLNIIGMLDLNFEGKVIYKNEILNSQNKSSIQQYLVFCSNTTCQTRLQSYRLFNSQRKY